MPSRAERAALNEQRFRAANERRFGVLRFLPGYAVYVCECSRVECEKSLRLRREDYLHVRADPAQFVVLPGHVDLEFEVVAEQRLRWTIVRKTGEAGQVARELAAGDE